MKNSTSTLMFSGMKSADSPMVAFGMLTWSYVVVSMKMNESASA